MRGTWLSIFQCVKDLFNSSPIFGTGLGDVQNDLDACYRSHGFNSLVDMNAHNQYFQYVLGTGLMGLILYLTFMIFFIRKAAGSKNYLLLGLLILFSLCCLTESLLERQHGVMFFSFFSSMLYFYPLKSDAPNNPPLNHSFF